MRQREAMSLTLLLLAAVTMLELALRRPFLATLAGRALVALTGAEERPAIFAAGPHRVFLAPGPPPWFLSALGRRVGTCLGHVVVLFGSPDVHTARLEIHEVAHARQWTTWGTLPFLVVYFASWLFQWIRVRDARDAYYHVPFEVEAYRAMYGESWTPPEHH